MTAGTTGRERLTWLARELLIAIGDDPGREGLEHTPTRVAETWLELFAGMTCDPFAPLASVFPIAQDDDALLPSGAVILRDIRFRSVCEHHLLPFTGVAHVAYLPREHLVGLSALPKLVDVLARRPQVQERLGEEIASTLFTAVSARGALVVIDAVHQCVTMRSLAQASSSVVTIAARGVFLEPAARTEIMALMAPARENEHP